MKKEVLQINNPSEDAQAQQIEEAKSVLKEWLLKDPGKRAGVYFSSGKDSLLTALLAVEVSQELGIKRPCLLSSLVPYEISLEKEWNNYLIKALKGVDWLATEPTEFKRLSVLVLGVGAIPPTHTKIKGCNKLFKTEPLRHLTESIKGQFLPCTGVRKIESRGRAERFEKYGYWDRSRGYLTPIINVDDVTLWNYLEKNLHKIGVEFAKLQKIYENKKRGGCWFCPNQRFKDTPESLEKEITLNFHSYFSQNHKDYNERRAIYGEWDDAHHIGYRTKLEYCRQWYQDVQAIQKKWGRELIGETQKKLIFEIWNWREKFGRISQKDFLRTLEDVSYSPLYPELFNIVFQKKGKRYIYARSKPFWLILDGVHYER